MRLVDVFHILTISGPLPQPFAAVSQLPAALRHPQKKHVLDLLSMYLVDVVDVCRFLLRSVGGAAGTRGDLRSVDTLYC